MSYKDKTIEMMDFIRFMDDEERKKWENNDFIFKVIDYWLLMTEKQKENELQNVTLSK